MCEMRNVYGIVENMLNLAVRFCATGEELSHHRRILIRDNLAQGDRHGLWTQVLDQLALLGGGIDTGGLRGDLRVKPG